MCELLKVTMHKSQICVGAKVYGETITEVNRDSVVTKWSTSTKETHPYHIWGIQRLEGERNLVRLTDSGRNWS